ncbi:MAG: hypothetical protein LKG25_04665 [Prevotella sp.]|jgi:flagellar motor switch/type III secretory pathway protein FliN|nr:hypothetical protein [Prevotella sp.]MCI1281868.1 hypothetical protein [Prevotella sp.]
MYIKKELSFDNLLEQVMGIYQEEHTAMETSEAEVSRLSEENLSLRNRNKELEEMAQEFETTSRNLLAAEDRIRQLEEENRELKERMERYEDNARQVVFKVGNADMSVDELLNCGKMVSISGNQVVKIGGEQ